MMLFGSSETKITIRKTIFGMAISSRSSGSFNHNKWYL